MPRPNILPVFLLAALSLVSGCRSRVETGSEPSVREVVDNLVTRLYDTYTPVQMDTLSSSYILSLLTGREKEVLAERYWMFDVSVPSKVSLMRDKNQGEVPFWLQAAGFSKTDLTVENEMSVYEVWQKDFPAGRVRLGINGFDKHRPVYFVSVKPLSENDSLSISPVFPESQHIMKMDTGAFTYHDWDGLVLTKVPGELRGGQLLTTIRGRAREAHLIRAFRDTPYPSSVIPDQVLLTWSGNPASSQDIQWRTAKTVGESLVQYWPEGLPDTASVAGEAFVMEDRLLRNDRYVNRYTARLRNLEAGTKYRYRVGSSKAGWTETFSFETAPGEAKPFSYIWFGDTHHSPVFGDMLQKTRARHPDVSFYQIAGDLVSTGLHRDDWDKLFAYTGNVFASKPVMTIPGNHDSQDGLGAWMYKEMFSYPENGPSGVPAEMTYAYRYGNALFLMIDATSSLQAQTDWITKQLSETDAAWKFVMFHFPPYNFVEPYPEIIAEWGPVFDKYHVDMVMGGHMHYYLRTSPIYHNQVVDDFSKGTVYTMSISIEGKQDEWPEEKYAVKRYPGGPLYQHMTIDGNTLRYVCYDPEGNIKDELSITR
ncbi:MAG: metallophosphoesterase [Cytophagaceae bacterium SCN 52-12]|nr:MAG: metallophosphoesterase [Cytophagaceae bacterium SCN 52-12]